MAVKNPYPITESSLYTQDFEDAVANYIEGVVEIERKRYDSTLEPFDLYAQKIRERLSEAWHAFRKSYVTGYSILLAEVSKMFPDDDDALIPYYADPELLSTLQTADGFADFLERGKTIYMLLGYTNEVMQNFYKAAYKLLVEGRIKEGFDAFFYLVTIAPNEREFWLNYGYAALQLGEHMLAIEAYGRAFDLDPNKADAYLAAASVYLRLQDFQHANEVCDLGLTHALTHRGEPWAEELGSMLEEGKRQIAALSGS